MRYMLRILFNCIRKGHDKICIVAAARHMSTERPLGYAIVADGEGTHQYSVILASLPVLIVAWSWPLMMGAITY